MIPGSGRPVPIPLTPRVIDGIEAVVRLRARVAQDPALKNVRFDELLKSAQGRIVMTGRIGDQPVIIKQILTDDAHQAVTAISSELQRIAPRYTNGPLRLAELRASWPQYGLYAKVRVPGDPMVRLLSLVTPDRRRSMLSRAGAWFARYSDNDRAPAPLILGQQLMLLKDARLDNLPAALRGPVDALRQRLLARADRIAGVRATYGRTHGDFVPGNLIVHKGDIWGIDIGVDPRMPLALEIARFVNWAALAVPDGEGGDNAPDAGDDHTALGADALLQATGDPAAMRFFDGFALFRLANEMAPAPSLHARLAQRIARHLSGQRSVISRP